MEPRTFCDALNRETGDYLLATVLEGAAQGAQLLLCGGVPIWPEHPASGSVQPRVWWSAAAVMWGHRWCGWQSCWVCLSAP